MWEIFHNPDLAQLIMRIPIGLFFFIRGGQKVFFPPKREGLKRTLEADHYPFVNFFSWWIPGWQFVTGLLLMLGLFTAFSAAVLGLICLVALLTDKITEVRLKRNPETRCDWTCCMIYVSEVPMGLIFINLIMTAPGMYSLDYLLQ